MLIAYDSGNIFAKILRGELPCFKVYETEHVLAFLDIMPRGDGHTLVIPKAQARNLFDVGADQLGHVFRVVQLIAVASKRAFNADGITIQQFNEAAGGQVVFHLHVHVIPRFEGVPMKAPGTSREEASVLENNALRLQRVIHGLA